MVGTVTLALILSACGVIGSGDDEGTVAPGGGWVTDAAVPTEPSGGAAPAGEPGRVADESRMSATQIGATHVVTYRPYLDDGSLAPGFSELGNGDSLWLCSPWRDHFSCRQDGYPEVVSYFCSTDGLTAWCPSDRDETLFTRIDNIRVLESRDESMQVTGQVPIRVELADGLKYKFMADTRVTRPDATIVYKSQSPDALWAPRGRSAIDTSTGAWTAYRAPSSGSAGPLEPVDVMRAVLIA